ncbi:MAG: hypothetical protein RL637_1412 [Pseudomonadota bacterium]|jgi:hypothetical protein
MLLSLKLTKLLIFSSFFLASLTITAEAKTMYRWVDEQGRVSFSDQVPPTQAQHQRETLDKNAQVISVTEKAKTKEQIEMDKRLTLLRRQQEQIIAKQNAEDKALLSSFIKLEDMDANHQNKLKAFAAQEQDKQKQIKKIETDIANLQTEAAGYEKKGQKAPADLLRRIESNQKDIEKIKIAILGINQDRNQFQNKYIVDRQRFIHLSQIRRIAPVNEDHEKPIEPATDQLGLFNCSGNEQCNKAWQIARDFVKTHSTTAITIDTDKIVTTAAPGLATDLSLSISKIIVEENKLQIFLDIRCTDIDIQSQLCSNTKAGNLRAEFISQLKNGLGLK